MRPRRAKPAQARVEHRVSGVPRPKASHLKLVLKVGAILIAIIGILSSFCTILGTVWPRISVSQFPEDNPASAISLKFEVANTGWLLPLQNLSFRFWIPAVYAGAYQKYPKCEHPPRTVEDNPFRKIGTLRTGEKIVVPVFGVTQLPPEDDVTIVLDLYFRYRPFFSFWPVREQVRMVSLVDRTGKTRWVQHPVDDLESVRRGRPLVGAFPINIKDLQNSVPLAFPEPQDPRKRAFSLETGIPAKPPK